MTTRLSSFNTQPRGGGCFHKRRGGIIHGGFQHSAARRRLRLYQRNQAQPASFNTQPRGGGCAPLSGVPTNYGKVSTLSRAEAAAYDDRTPEEIRYSFNTQPRGGGCDRRKSEVRGVSVSTLSRAEAAALGLGARLMQEPSFNTQPRGGGC